VDVEDYFQVWAFSNVVDREHWDGFERRVGDATRRCLDLFDRFGVKATFFTLGWVAKREKDLVREIVDRGHELASHGLNHVKARDQTRAEFRADAAGSKQLLEDIAGVPVAGYRAAGFSIDRATPWAHETLAEIGYRYSSSVHPIAHDHYGDPTAPQRPFFPVAGASFVEAPVATVRIFGRRVSCAGGGWFRATPVSLSKTLLRRAADTLGGPVIFYFHPWEIDPDQPRINGATAMSKWRHYLNLRRMPEKLSQVLETFSWRRIDEALALDQTGARL
jgi:polysaccharide deacetylase family protein (PEP-CTERM system associated)